MRPVRGEDEPALYELFAGLSSESRTFRFFSAGSDLHAAARQMATVDYAGRYGLVALRGDDERIVGQASYFLEPDNSAEVAFTVADEMRGHGLATLLLAHLAEVAEENAISLFVASVMPENHRMVEVFRESGLPFEISSEPGGIRVEMPTSLSPEAVERFEHRDQLAAQAAVHHFLAPRSVAVIGASRERQTVGGAIFHNLLQSELRRPRVPCQPGRRRGAVGSGLSEHQRGARARSTSPWSRCPPRLCSRLANHCAQRGVPALIVISAGFSETGAEGAELERQLLEICRRSGMRLLGPELPGRTQHGPRGQPRRHVCPREPSTRSCRLRHSERRARTRADRARQRSNPRRLVLRLDRQPR